MLGSLKRTVGRKAFVTGATQLVRAIVVALGLTAYGVTDQLVGDLGQALGWVAYGLVMLAYAAWELMPVVQAYMTRGSEEDPPTETIETKRRIKAQAKDVRW